VLTGHVREGADLVLTVEIRYLAQRIQSDFVGFTVRLVDAGPAVFFPWANAPGSSDVIEPAEHLFDIDLDILQGKARDGTLCVICNQSNPALPFCGGEMVLTVRTAIVTDPSGKVWELEALKALSRAYWEEFSQRGA